MPGVSVMVADGPCAQQQTIGLSNPVQAPVVALPSMVHLLLREALNMKISVAVLHRLLDRHGDQPFSERCIDVLRSRLRAELLSDLFELDTRQVETLPITHDERSGLMELCESLKQGLNSNGLSPPLPAQATPYLPYIHGKGSQPQQTPVATSDSEGAQTPVVAEETKALGSGKASWPEHEAKHFAGECQPCAYFYKPDSCKWGVKCDFCHLCPEGEIKTRKKEKIRALKEAARERKAEQTPQVVPLSLSSALNYF